MEQPSTETTKADFGRPLIVYDEDFSEKEKKPSFGSEIRMSKLRRLPGRDISISSDEDEEGDDVTNLKPIEIVEDPTIEKRVPRKSSMLVNGPAKLPGGSPKKFAFVDSLNLKTTASSSSGMTTSSSANELMGDRSTGLSELASPVDPNFIHTRKRSVSFLPPSPPTAEVRTG